MAFCDTFNTIDITDILSVIPPYTCVESDGGGGDPFGDRNTDPAFPELLSSTCVLNASSIIKTTPLDDIKTLPCSLEVPPYLPINPDQRDTLFPAVTPKLTTTRYSSRGCIPTTSGSTVAFGSTSKSTDALGDTGWTKPGSSDEAVASKVTVLSRIGFDTTDGFYGFYRDFSYNSCGELIKISAETPASLEDVGPCPG